MFRTLAKTSLALALVVGMGVAFVPQAQAHSVVIRPRTVVHTNVLHPRTVSAQVSSISITQDRGGVITLRTGTHRAVHFTKDTDFMRRYGGTIGPSDVAAGDHLIINGYLDGHGRFIATTVRDMSIWVYGVAWHTATVSSINTSTNTIVVTGDNWRNQSDTVTIRYTDTVPFVYANGTTSNDASVRVGDTIRVHGQARLQNGQISVINVAKVWITNR